MKGTTKEELLRRLKTPATDGPAAVHGSDVPVQGRGRWLRELWQSSVGKKIVVAVTGAILAGYVVLHALGNLKAFQGAGGGEGAAIDHYAEWLRTVGEPAIPREGVLWAVRVVLLAALVIHIVGVTQLFARNRAARPTELKTAPRIGRSLASRTMLISGVLILAFVVFHVLHFTTRTIDVTPLAEGTVYANLHGAFQEWYFVAIYMIVPLLLGLHLLHALWSAVQTGGWDKPNRNPSLRYTATAIAAAVAIGFAAVPLAFATGALPDPEPSGEPIEIPLLPPPDGLDVPPFPGPGSWRQLPDVPPPQELPAPPQNAPSPPEETP